jgi:hypothetical protein
VYWFKQIFAVFIGIACGIVPLTGVSGLAVFAISIATLSYIFGFFWLRLDEELVGGPFAVATEGGFTAFSIFMITWVLTYTVIVDPELLL